MSDDHGLTDAPRERSTYSSFGDDYRGFDAREEEGGSKGLLVAGLAVGVVLVFGTVVWNAYRAGVKSDLNDTPVIKADNNAFKKRPDEQGGFTVPNQDKRLFDVIDNNDRSTKVPATTKTESVSTKELTDGVPTDLRPGRNTTDADKAVIPAPKVTPTPTQTAEPTLIPTPTPVPTYKPLPAQGTFDQSGSFLVQLMALRDVQSAEKAWSQIVETHPDLFAGAVMDIQKADLGSKGIFYRLRVSAFANREDADKFCQTLKSRNQSCMVAKRS